MTGDDFIGLATRIVLSGTGNPEARFRSAVSRAYYGAYHLAASFLRGLGAKIPKNSDCHIAVYRLLINSGNAEAQEAARLLDDLRRARNEADYDLDEKRLASQASARADVEIAVALQAVLKQCQQEPAASAIKASIARVT